MRVLCLSLYPTGDLRGSGQPTIHLISFRKSNKLRPAWPAGDPRRFKLRRTHQLGRMELLRGQPFPPGTQ